MSKIKQQTTIKEMILATIEEHIDAQNEKGMKKYGQTLEDCPADDYNWQKMALEEAIDLMQYQQKEIGRLFSERDEIIEDLEDEIEGLKKELESSRGEYLHLRILANNAAAESKKLRDLLIHAWGED